VGLAVTRDQFDAIRQNWGFPNLSNVPDDVGVDEFEIFTNAYENGQDKILHHAPWLLLFHAHVEAPMAEVNAGLALLNASYVCEGLNLGCFFSGIVLAAAQNDKKIPRLLCLPDNHKIFGALVIGHPKFKYKNWIQRRNPKTIWV